MIYFDGAATSYPKPKEVVAAWREAAETPWGNAGRSGHALSRRAADGIFAARERLSEIVGAAGPERICFCGGATAALNFAITGTVRARIQKTSRPLRVMTSPTAHNAVLRPLFALEREGLCQLSFLPLNEDLSLDEARFCRLRPELCALSVRTNTTGREWPLRRVRQLLDGWGGILIADGAQAMGCGRCRLSDTGAHLLAFPSHKGLMGMMGAGALAVAEELPFLPEPLLFGGAGGDSRSREMPSFLPERLEAGTLPLPAILSMKAGADFLLREGVEAVEEKEREDKRLLREGLLNMPSWILYDVETANGPTLINHRRLPSEQAAALLDEEGILCRGGFHCAPLAHRLFGTGPYGALRLSGGYFTTKAELGAVLDALFRLSKQ